jgi:hypothetical protein
MGQAPAIDAADFRFVGKGSTSHGAAWLAAQKQAKSLLFKTSSAGL